MIHKLNKNYLFIFICLFYLIGLIGLVIPNTQNLFRNSIPFSILISILLMLFFHQNYNAKFILSFILIFLFGFIIEVFGVSLGCIFGNYYYNAYLGPKLFSVPLLIGLNWFFLVYSSSSFIAKFNLNIFLSAFLVAMMMLVFDISLEFFAIYNHMWIWVDTNLPPLQNFFSWFIIAFILALIYHYLNKPISSNSIANRLIFIMFCFFLLFDIIIYLIC